MVASRVPLPIALIALIALLAAIPAWAGAAPPSLARGEVDDEGPIDPRGPAPTRNAFNGPPRRGFGPAPTPAVPPTVDPALPDNFGQPLANRIVYDRSATISWSQRLDIEERARRIVDLGIPTVVFIRSRQANYAETEADARDLMARWGVESKPGARDGLVIFFNARPRDKRYGSVALVAGDRLDGAGTLPTAVLAGIYTREMAPLLRRGRVAQGLNSGLDSITLEVMVNPLPHDPPGDFERAAATTARWPLNVAAGIVAVALIAWCVVVWRRRPRSTAADPALTAGGTPGDLAPALAATLVHRPIPRHAGAFAEGTLRALASRAALDLEPESDGERIVLRQPDAASAPHERAVWSALDAVAIGDAARTVPAPALARLRRDRFWPGLIAALRDEATANGWLDLRAERERRRLTRFGAGALVGAAAAVVIGVLGRETWGFLATGALTVSGAVAIALGTNRPVLSVDGMVAAQPWHRYRDRLREAGRGRGTAWTGRDSAYAAALGIPDPAVPAGSPRPMPAPAGD